MKYLFQAELVTGFRSIAHKSYPTGYAGALHWHGPDNGYELIYVDSGQITVDFEKDLSFVLNAGNCCFIKSFSRHRLINTEKGPSSYLNMMFYGKLPDSLCHHPQVVSLESHRISARLREAAMDSDAYSSELCCCILTEFIISLLRNVVQTHPVIRPRFIDNFQTERAEKIFDIISREYRTITFAQLSRRVGVSRTKLYLIFRNELGHTFSGLIDRFKLEQAEYLLQQTPLSLPEIAAEIGCDKSTFFRLFKRLKGITPSQYARTLGNGQTKTETQAKGKNKS
ncbi:MAG: helix-turn-helix domain-containing protein [Lentisphaeria bacterium]|nr:helix-turn-helix domain-containing protein [Lentisphaeria bacterium]